MQFYQPQQNVIPKPFAHRRPDRKNQSKNESPKRKRSKARVRICANGPRIVLPIGCRHVRGGAFFALSGKAGASAAAAPKSGASTSPATMPAGSVMTGGTWGGHARVPSLFWHFSLALFFFALLAVALSLSLFDDAASRLSLLFLRSKGASSTPPRPPSSCTTARGLLGRHGADARASAPPPPPHVFISG